MALSGRESLIRLVGKRRRYLPNRQSLLSTPLSGPFDLCIGDKDGRMVYLEDKMDGLKAKKQKYLAETLTRTSSSSSSSSSSQRVTCPVCGVKVGGGEYMINSHLDGCLSRGTKRKLTQRTLLQFNFCSQSMAQISTGESKKLRSNSETEASNENLVQNNAICNENSASVKENGNSFAKLCVTGEIILGVVFSEKPVNSTEGSTKKPVNSTEGSTKKPVNSTEGSTKKPVNSTEGSTKKPVNSTEGSTKKTVNADLKNCQVYCSSLSLETEFSKKCDLVITMDDVVGEILGTFIVGRRFSLERDLRLAARISLLRDPNNAKDPNAIKVLLADSSCCKVLGFLPRELAQYLSPLIEKYCLTFEGSVTSVPKHSFDAVPIQIVCSKAIILGDEDLNQPSFTCLWKNVLRVVASADRYIPSTTRYQQNFCLLIQEVIKSNPHLFSDDEKSFMESFFHLSDDSQRLFIRLYTRKGPWFRMSSILYPEIMDSQWAVKELSAMGYMCCYDYTNKIKDEDMKDLLDLFTISELHEIMRLMQKNCTRGGRKQDLIASVLSSYEGGECTFLPRSILDRTGTCIKISTKAESLVWRAERLFFLNGEQDLSAFLLVDLGILKYPSYCCIITEQIFSSRSGMLAYEEAIELAQIMDESLDKSDRESVLKCMKIAVSQLASSSGKAIQTTGSDSLHTSSYFSAPWVYSKVIFVGISFLEHERRYKEAIDLLKLLLLSFPCDGRRGYWTLRLSIDLEHVGHHNGSLSVAEDGLLDPWVRAGSRTALQRRVLRLGKPPRRWKAPSFSNSIKRKIREVHIQGRPLKCETGMKSRFYGQDGEQCGVEELALQYYAGEGGGWHGVHTESGIWLTIFGLLMWDIIFSDVPNVFRNKFQTAPLDLESDSFYPKRKSLLESRLQEIQDGMAEEILISSWEMHAGIACRGVKWDRHSLAELRAAVTCIGAPCLVSLCRNLAQDYRSWSSGMPDLLLWRFHGEYRGEAKLVEVKGPMDRLSEQQRAWLLLLMDCGFDTEICKVNHC